MNIHTEYPFELETSPFCRQTEGDSLPSCVLMSLPSYEALQLKSPNQHSTQLMSRACLYGAHDRTGVLAGCFSDTVALRHGEEQNQSLLVPRLLLCHKSSSPGEGQFSVTCLN